MTTSFGIHIHLSDIQARQENYLSKLDVRLKLGMVLLMISLVMVSEEWWFPLAILFVSALVLRFIEVPFSRMKIRLLAPFSIVFFLVLVQPFLVSGKTFWEFNSGGWFHLKASLEGLYQAILIGSKVLGSVSVLLCLIYTTTLDKLIMAAAWLKIPSVLIDISLLMYRYAFVFIKETARVFQAQKLRFGYASYKNGLRSCAVLLGMVFIRAFDQASRTQQAMNLRLYQGDFKPTPLPPLFFREAFIPALTGGCLIIVFLVQRGW